MSRRALLETCLKLKLTVQDNNKKSYPWGELSMGRVVHGASSPFGEFSMGRVVYGASCHGTRFDGASCPWGEFRWASGPGTKWEPSKGSSSKIV
jgi:hypothetical protein